MTKIIEKPIEFSVSGKKAVGFELEDVVSFICGMYPQLTVTTHKHECEHTLEREYYITIKGVCADLRLDVDFGSVFNPTRGLICRVMTKRGVDYMYVPDSLTDEYGGVLQALSLNGNYSGLTMNSSANEQRIYSQYEAGVACWLGVNIKYIQPDPSLFTRIDIISFDESENKEGDEVHGEFECTNSPLSFDAVIIDEADFYTSDEVELNSKARMIKRSDMAPPLPW